MIESHPHWIRNLVERRSTAIEPPKLQKKINIDFAI